MDAETAWSAWFRLSAWVAWLVDRFDLGDEIPSCWWAHGALVEELTALWAAWRVAYRHPDSGGDQPLRWLADLDEVRKRVRTWDRTGCARGTHRAYPSRAWVPDTAAFEAHATADIAERRLPEHLSPEHLGPEHLSVVK